MNKLHHGALGCAEDRGRVTGRSEESNQTPPPPPGGGGGALAGAFLLSRARARGTWPVGLLVVGRFVCNPCFYLFIFFYNWIWICFFDSLSFFFFFLSLLLRVLGSRWMLLSWDLQLCTFFFSVVEWDQLFKKKKMIKTEKNKKLKMTRSTL